MSRCWLLVAALVLAAVGAGAGAPSPAPTPTPPTTLPAEATQLFPDLAAAARQAAAQHGPASPEAAAALQPLAEALYEKGRLAAAATVFELQLAIREGALGPEHADVAQSCNDLGVVLHEAHDYERARSYLERAAALREKTDGPDSRAVADVLYSLASTLQAHGDLAAAEAALQRTLAIQERLLGPDDLEVADTLNKLGSVRTDRGDYAAATAAAERALAVRERALGPDHPRVANSLTVLANLASTLGDHAAARAANERALAIREKAFGPENPLVALSLNNIATCCLELGDYVCAAERYRRALAIREKAFGGEDVSVAEVLSATAVLQRMRGQYTEAERLALRALAIDEKKRPAGHPAVAYDLTTLAVVRYDRGDFTAARAAYERAAAITEKALGAEHASLATILNNMTGVLFAQGDLTAARRTAERALAIREKALGPDHPLVGSSLNNLAAVLRAQGDAAAARPAYERAIAIQTKQLGEEHRLLAAALHNLALVLEDEGDTAGVRRLLERSLAMREKVLGPDHPETASSLAELGRVCLDAGDVAAARPLVARALAIRRGALPPDHPELAASLDLAGRLDWLSGDEKAARADFMEAAQTIDRVVVRLMPALAFAEQRAFLDKYVPTQTSWLLSSHRDGVELEAAYGLVHRFKGLLVESLRRQTALQRLGADPSLAARVDRLQSVRASIAGLYHRAGTVPQAEWDAAWKALSDEKESLERELAAAAPPGALADRLAGLDLAGLRLLLTRDEAFVDVYRYAHRAAGRFVEDRYAAVVTTARQKPVLVDLGPAAAAERAVTLWRNRVLRVQPDDEELAAVRTLLWEPVAAALPGRTSRVWLSPDGELARVPWHLLPGPGGATLLLSQVDSARELARLRRTPEPVAATAPSLLLAGGVDFGGAGGTGAATRGDDFEPLPGTMTEVTGLQALGRRDGLGVTLLTGAAASKREVTGALGRATYVHLATHGFFYAEGPTPVRGRGAGAQGAAAAAGRNPLVESGIALAGANLRDPATFEAPGLLTAEELVGLDLSGCRLVTLSACETGRGEEVTGQGVMGLRAAVLAAGARSVVMSLWAVPDESTERLMQAFYEGVWTRRLAPAEALRRAQFLLRDEPSGRSAASIHWAGWVLAGAGW